MYLCKLSSFMLRYFRPFGAQTDVKVYVIVSFSKGAASVKVPNSAMVRLSGRFRVADQSAFDPRACSVVCPHPSWFNSSRRKERLLVSEDQKLIVGPLSEWYEQKLGSMFLPSFFCGSQVLFWRLIASYFLWINYTSTIGETIDVHLFRQSFRRIDIIWAPRLPMS